MAGESMHVHVFPEPFIPVAGSQELLPTQRTINPLWCFRYWSHEQKNTHVNLRTNEPSDHSIEGN
eukprot:c4242_g1_i2 orf=75-269(-)